MLLRSSPMRLEVRVLGLRCPQGNIHIHDYIAILDRQLLSSIKPKCF